MFTELEKFKEKKSTIGSPPHPGPAIAGAPCKRILGWFCYIQLPMRSSPIQGQPLFKAPVFCGKCYLFDKVVFCCIMLQFMQLLVYNPDN